MRALLIDPTQRSIAEIDFRGDNSEIQRLIGGRDLTTGAYLIGSLPAGYDIVYADDTQLEDKDDLRDRWNVVANRDPPSSYRSAAAAW